MHEPKRWAWRGVGALALLGLLSGCGGGVEADADREAREEGDGQRVLGEAALSALEPTGDTLVFGAVADARVESAAPASALGTSSRLGADGSPSEWSYLRFDVAGLASRLAAGYRVSGASVRLYATDATAGGPELSEAPGGWSEPALTWNGRPRFSDGTFVRPALARAGSVPASSWMSLGAAGAIARRQQAGLPVDGAYDFALVPTSTDGVDLVARESSQTSLRPQLVITLTPPGECQPSTASVTAEADFSVAQAATSPASAQAPSLFSDASPREEAFLQFRLLRAANLRRATVRLWVTNGSADGPALHAVDPATWKDQASYTWADRPTVVGGALADVGSVASGSWVSYDVTAHVAAAPPVAAGSSEVVVGYALLPTSSDGLDVDSRNGATAARRPQLQLEYGCTAPPPPTGSVTRRSFTLGAAADTHTDAKQPWTAFGSAPTLVVDLDPGPVHGHLAFDLSSVQGRVVSARLRLYATNGSVNGPRVFVSPNHWREAELVWERGLGSVGQVGDMGSVATNAWSEVDVTEAFLGASRVSFELVPDSTDGVGFSSREAADTRLRPQLLLTTEEPTCAPESGDSAAVGSTRWARNFAGTGGHVTASAVAVDPQGHVAFAGDYWGSVDFGGGPLPDHGNQQYNPQDLVVARYTADGAHLASRGFGAAAGFAYAHALATAANGDLLVVGSSSGMGTDVGALPPGAFLMRLSPALQTLWAQVPQGWSPEDVAVDAQGNLLAAGRAPHAATPDDYSSDLVVVKLSPEGHELWRRVLVASDTAQAWSVAVDAQGNVVVGGHASGALRFGTASLPQAPNRPLLMKLDASGNLLWWKRYDGEGSYSSQRGVQEVAVAPDGTIVASGHFDATLRIAGERRVSDGLYAGFVIALEPDGRERWWRWLGSDGFDTFPNALAVDRAGNVVVAGGYSGGLDFGGGMRRTAYSAQHQRDSGGLFAAKYRLSCGEHRWSRQMSGSWEAYATGAAVDASGNLFLTGGHGGSVDTGAGVFGSASSNNYEGLLLRLAP